MLKIKSVKAVRFKVYEMERGLESLKDVESFLAGLMDLYAKHGMIEPLWRLEDSDSLTSKQLLAHEERIYREAERLMAVRTRRKVSRGQ